MVYGDRLAARVRAEGAIALALGSALIGATASRIVFPNAPASAVVLASMLAVLGLTAGTRPSRREDDSDIEWLAVFGMLVSVPATVALARPSGVCLALFLAPPAGLALAALWWSLLAGLRELGADQAVEDGDLAMKLSGRWLALLGGVSAPTAFVASDAALGILATTMALGGAVRAIIGGYRVRRRLRFIDEVRRGELSRFRILPSTEFPRSVLDGLPALVRSPKRLDGVLVERTVEGPYRENGPGAPHARVPMQSDAPARLRVSCDALRGAVAVVGATFAPLMSLLLSAAAAEILARGSSPCTASADLLCGWLLILSGPSTGAALLVLSHLHRPARATVWWLGISMYLLACPFVCLLVSFAARLSCF